MSQATNYTSMPTASASPISELDVTVNIYMVDKKKRTASHLIIPTSTDHCTFVEDTVLLQKFDHVLEI